MDSILNYFFGQDLQDYLDRRVLGYIAAGEKKSR